jgi:hypothetical protein
VATGKRPACVARILLISTLAASETQAVELVGRGKIFMRFANTRPDSAGILVRVNVVPNHEEPFGWNGKTVYVGLDGESETPKQRYLLPRQSSPWIDVGQYMNREGARSWEATYLSPVICGVLTEPKSKGLYVLAEVAQGPGTQVMRRLEIAHPDLPAESEKRDYPWVLGYSAWNGTGPFVPSVGLLIPSRPDISPRVYTFEEGLNWQLDFIAEFPQWGRRPDQIVFTAYGRPQILEALGYNGYPAGTAVADLGDEISIRISLSGSEQNRRFRQAMQAKGISPLDLINGKEIEKAKTLPPEKQWEMVSLVPPLPERPVQYYESAIFRYQLWYKELAAKKDDGVERHPGKRVLAGANFSPHMNVWPDVRQWVGPFKAGAMNMCWTEDWWWQVPELSPQVYGFLLDAFRLAQSYHGAAIQFYIMPFRGNSVDNFRRMHGLALAHGARVLNHFHVQDQELITWDYVDLSESPRTFEAIHDVMRKVGAVEHRLYPAVPRKAQAAIMLSWAADTWDTEDLGGAGHLYSAQYNVNNDERKSLWTALRHAQYPVDLITDEDIAEGRLQDYRVLYVVGAEMLGAATEPLRNWVRQGGIVYATGGGGLLDEYHRPNASLLEMYGIKGHELARKIRHIEPRNTLPQSQPLDTVRFEAAAGGPSAMDLPALLYRETVVPAEGARVIGRYQSDHSAAAVLSDYGRGKAFYMGALAGVAYVAPAMPPSSDVLPTGFPEDRRQLITAPLRWARIASPVTSSDPLVEAQYMDGPNGAIVVLINWREKPLDDLTVSFPGTPQIRSVRSLQAAGYFRGHLHEQQGGSLAIETTRGTSQVRTRLEVIDFLLVN